MIRFGIASYADAPVILFWQRNEKEKKVAARRFVGYEPQAPIGAVTSKTTVGDDTNAGVQEQE